MGRFLRIGTLVGTLGVAIGVAMYAMGYFESGADESIGDVLVATDKNMRSLKEEHEVLLVKYYAPWCGHCKRLAPEWEKVATELKGTVGVAKLDATVEDKAARDAGVRGYPTIILYHKGVEHSYEGDRSSEAIIEFALSYVGDLVKKIGSPEELEKLVQRKGAVVAVYDENLQDSIEAIADKMRMSVPFVQVTDKKMIEKEGKGKIVLHKTFDEKKQVFEPKGDDFAEDLKKFVMINSLPLVSELTRSNVERIMETRMPLVFLLVDVEDEDATEKATEALRGLGSRFRGKAILVYADRNTFPQAERFLHLSGKKFPALSIVKNTSMFPFPEDESITTERLAEHIDGVLNGTVKPHIKSDPVPEVETEAGMTTVVGSTFERLVSKPEDADVLVEFYTTNCGECEAFASDYAALAAKLEKVPGVRVAKIDATANDFDRGAFPVQGFPTFMFVPKGGGEAKNFEGDRSIKGLLDFVKSHSSADLSGVEA